MCQFFGLDVDQGAQAFAIAEIFLGFYNMLLGSTYAHDASENADRIEQLEAAPYLLPQLEEEKKRRRTILICYAFLATFLLIQGLLGFVLYPLGYKQRMKAVCWAWMGIACLNVFNFFFLVGIIFAFAPKDINGDTVVEWKPILKAMYLLYPIIGIVTLFPFTYSASSSSAYNQEERRVMIDSNPTFEEGQPDEDTYYAPAHAKDDDEGGHEHLGHKKKKKRKHKA